MSREFADLRCRRPAAGLSRSGRLVRLEGGANRSEQFASRLHAFADRLPGWQRIPTEVELCHRVVVCGVQPSGYIRVQVEGRTGGEVALGARFGRFSAVEVGASDVADADHDFRDLVTVGKQIEDTIVAEQLIHIVEVPTDAAVGYECRIAFKRLGRRIDVSQLFQERPSRVEHDDVERLEVGELTQVGSRGGERVAQEAADRNSLVRVRATPHAHLQDNAGSHQRGRVARAG